MKAFDQFSFFNSSSICRFNIGQTCSFKTPAGDPPKRQKLPNFE